MSHSLDDLLFRREAIERQIQHLRDEGRARALASVRRLMSEHGLALADLDLPMPTASKQVVARKVAPKFRDPTTGETWSGRGLTPRWLARALQAGRAASEFAV